MKNTMIIISFILLANTLPAQVISDSLLVDGHYRSFHFNKPPATSSGASLVFILHGSGGNGKGMMERSKKLLEKSDAEKILLVYPDGYKKYWNECRKAATSLANQENIDENTFFDGMINYFKSKQKINPRQVFAIGTSGGGHMVYKLAITMPDKFKAITAIIANLPDIDNMDCAESKVARPVMIVNGTADQVNPYEGGLVDLGNVKMGRVRSTDRTFQYWASLAGYTGDPVKALMPDNDPSDGKTIERYTYKNPGKPEVVLLKVIGGKHDYPGDIDVHVEAWEFFKRQL